MGHSNFIKLVGLTWTTHLVSRMETRKTKTNLVYNKWRWKSARNFVEDKIKFSTVQRTRGAAKTATCSDANTTGCRRSWDVEAVVPAQNGICGKRGRWWKERPGANAPAYSPHGYFALPLSSWSHTALLPPDIPALWPTAGVPAELHIVPPHRLYTEILCSSP